MTEERLLTQELGHNTIGRLESFPVMTWLNAGGKQYGFSFVTVFRQRFMQPSPEYVEKEKHTSYLSSRLSSPPGCCPRGNIPAETSRPPSSTCDIDPVPSHKNVGFNGAVLDTVSC